VLGGPRSPRIIPNPFDNTLLIQGTRQEYESIIKLLRDIDVAPRQVLIEAKIYEVNLTGALASGVSAYLQQRSGTGSGSGQASARQFVAQLAQGGISMSAGALVWRSHELLASLALREVASQARVISAPSVVATDSVPASINVGVEVPTLTAQAVTGAQQAGTSLFANSIQNRQTGVTLQISARVNPSGIVTMIIGQEVSAPTPPPAGADVGIQSPSFSKRSVQTQVTVQDGDTIAIGGIINENRGNSSAGIPMLSRIPFVGAAFGSRSYNNERTELIIFLTPRVIFDQNDILDATEELKGNLRRLSKHIKE
jgi:general secretion pathway protein D